MIIEVCEALKTVFKDLTINVDNQDVKVNFNYGDQNDYNKWQFEMKLWEKQKYPLIWMPPSIDVRHHKQKNFTYDVDDELILFMGSELNYNNSERYVYNYIKYIKPLEDKIQSILERHPFIQLYENPVQPYDIPNFGTNNDADFDSSSSKKKDPKSITIDIVDARILKIKLNINVNCIIT